MLFIVSEISETLSLTNNTKQLLETTLDTVSLLLVTDCCWIQEADVVDRKLPLVSFRGFTSELRQELASLDMEHRFSDEIVGRGHKVVIPNLSRDGHYDIPAFERAGFRSLLAVPIMTYRVHGVMGVAYRDKRKFDKDFIGLVSVIANLIGMALTKTMLENQNIERKNIEPEPEPNLPEFSLSEITEPLLPASEDPSDNIQLPSEPAIESRAETADSPPPTVSEPRKNTIVTDRGFREHVKRMRDFSHAHPSLTSCRRDPEEVSSKIEDTRLTPACR